eukprot:scpid29660/ scgid4340/ Phospholipase D1; Choline phosphatase 1; Phosphatidylcholine-hydrolyzing phospholipase D1
MAAWSGPGPAAATFARIGESTQMTRRRSLMVDDDSAGAWVDDLVDAFESLWEEVEHTSAFKRSVPVRVEIPMAERDPLHHPLDPVLYTIKLTHGPYQWEVRRRYKHFIKLDSDLRLLWLRSKFSRHNRVPLARLPVRLDHRDAKKERLQEYLQKVLEIEVFRNHPASLKFLEVSKYSFFDDLGKVKGKEDIVRKHGGGYRIELQVCGCDSAGCCGFCCCPCISQAYRWTKRWLVIKDSFLMLVKDLLIQSWSERQAREWFIAIEKMRRGPGDIWTRQQRYDSFAPVRENSKALWFVDAEDYYSTVADAINSARYEIFIAGWWLSPELYLKRHIAHMEKWRLDNLLKRKAEAGVKISILIYKEIPQALGIQSLHTYNRLMGLHRNVTVLRHPDHRRQGIYYWGHHEKVVSIDQCISFVGGLDLCYGRWDNPQHVLTDLPRRRVRRGNDESDGAAMSTLDGVEAVINERSEAAGADGDDDGEEIHAGLAVAAPDQEPGSPRKRRGRMAKAWSRARQLGWLVRTNTSLDSGNDVPFSASTKPAVQRGMSVDELTEPAGEEDDGNPVCEICPPGEACCHYHLFPGQDYSNPLVRDFEQVHQPFIDLISRKEVPRLPWHDVHMCVLGPVAADLARHFIQRWNYAKYNKKLRVLDRRKVDFLLPRDLPPPDTSWINEVQLQDCEVQIVRSASDWSCGVPQESSILRAYCASIQNAEQFIYIENQFFISSQLDSSPQIFNPIVETLAERIARAHESHSMFHCYVILPLLPGFPGELDAGGVAKKAILHYIQSSIYRGPSSLFGRLRALGIMEPLRYVSFCGLRAHGKIQQKLVTEMIYIHSKLMIVDDRVVIMGSANINDRSMTGDRDTELAAVVRDTHMIPGCMNGKPYDVGRFAHSLRMSLFTEHLGCAHQECFDPNSDHFFKNVWLSRAAANTKILDLVFNCIPNDCVRRLNQLQQNRDTPGLKDTDPQKAVDMLRTVRGNLVLFPHQFLVDEDLRPPLTSKENLISLTVFT